MSYKQANILIVLLLLITVFLGIIAFRSNDPAFRTPIYEYREITANGIDEDYSEHNAWIKDGWEPIFLLQTDGVDARYLMRRLKR